MTNTPPILIISFNNHEFVGNTISQLHRLGIDDASIIVIDNASSWDESQAFLETLKCRVIRNAENFGHLCWARPEIYSTLPDKFCVTDPDLQFNPNLPKNFIEVMSELADRFQASKVGFALDIADGELMFQYPDYHLGQSILEWESQFWKQRVPGESLEVYLAEVDTTFHVFNKHGFHRRQLRVAGDYTAKHLPWYRTNPVIPPERMTMVYRHATRVSTIARFHMRQHEGLRDVELPVADPAAAAASRRVTGPASAVYLYQIAYSEETFAAVEPGYQVLDNRANERPDWYEYWPIRRFLLEQALDERAFYGFFSPKFGKKTQLNHAQVSEFVRQASADHDVVLFSPQPDMAAFFLNVFEQGELFDPGFIAATEGFLRKIGNEVNVRNLVMDSSQIVFSNYFVARPAFWRRWLEIAEQLFALCEGPDSPEKTACTMPTTYPGQAQRKVFMQERLASFVLATEPQWRAKAADPFGFAWSMTRFREYPTQAYISDALKLAYRTQRFPEYLDAYAKTREQFAKASSGAPEAQAPANATAHRVLPSVEALHRSKAGKASNKWASYLTYYDQLFAPLRHSPVRMLEIGVQNGGSLETWSQYFAQGQLFVGCDIDPKCGLLRYDDKRINIVVGDANAAETYEKIAAYTPQFDIVIDDGSHRSNDIINSFLRYFPHVSPGGLYVIEDTHCLYWNIYGGGVLNDYGAYAFFKRLVDVLGFEFWKDDLSINAYLRTFFDQRATPGFILDGWIDGIEFKNSVITIRKALQPGHEKLGEQILSGTEHQVHLFGPAPSQPAAARP